MIATLTIRITFGAENNEINGWNIFTFAFNLLCAHIFIQNDVQYAQS